MKFKWFAWGGLIMIAAILIAGIMFPGMCVMVCHSYAATGSIVRAIAMASKDYKGEFGTWPSSLSDLTNNPKSIVFIEWDDSGPVDPWGNKIVYIPFNQEVGYGLAISWGADGEPGGVKQDRDRIVKVQ